LTFLERTDIGNDGPTVLNGYLLSIRGHITYAIRYSGVKMAIRRLAQPIDMKAGSRHITISPRHYDTLAVAGNAMAYGTIYIIAVFSTIQKGFRNLHRNFSY